MRKLIQGIHHVALKCENEASFEKTLDFYENILGLTLKRRWGAGEKAGAMLDAGNCLIEIFASGRTQAQTGTVNHFAFAVEQVDACVEAIRAAGYAITREPVDVVIPAQPPFPIRIAFCVGPVGEEIELFFEK